MQEPRFSQTDMMQDAAETLLSVSALNRLVRTALESNFPLLRIGGEISNLTRAASGHVYFTLKDAQAQVRCVMWRNRAQLLPFRPENGMQVEARVLVTLYEVRGDFQLTVENLSRSGSGSLYEAFLRLKEKLSAEGLFDSVLKRPLPRFPRRVGIITSPTAAALQDVLSTLRRRAPHVGVILYPAQVQGAAAAAMLTEMMRTATRRAADDNIDALLLVRGGGSLEDLSAFNDEALARAIRESAVPVVSGVGHETDFTIADFAADLRAPTPTGAAELISAGYQDAGVELNRLTQTLSKTWTIRFNMWSQRLDRAALRLVHPQDRLKRAGEEVLHLRRRLSASAERQLERQRNRLQALELRLSSARPDLAREADRHARLDEALRRAMRGLLQAHENRLETLTSHLFHLAPQATLARGYSITRNAGGEILRRAEDAKDGERLSIQLAEGQLQAVVDKSATCDKLLTS